MARSCQQSIHYNCNFKHSIRYEILPFQIGTSVRGTIRFYSPNLADISLTFDQTLFEKDEELLVEFSYQVPTLQLQSVKKSVWYYLHSHSQLLSDWRIQSDVSLLSIRPWEAIFSIRLITTKKTKRLWLLWKLKSSYIYWLPEELLMDLLESFYFCCGRCNNPPL
jgi:hypothetical protein